MAFDLIAIDLDGTLLDSSGKLPAANRAALHRAHEAGLKVVLCTGRSYTETRPIIEQIGLDLDACVTVGGALLTQVATHQTLESEPIDANLAVEATRWFQERRYTVLWLLDRTVHGFDGYAIAGERRHPAIDRWMELSPVEVRAVDACPSCEALPLRITVVDETPPLESLSVELITAYAGRLSHNVIRVPSYGFTVMESCAANVDKWNGILKLCRRWSIDPARTVAIGDDVNDLPMIRSAGLGVAVGNARPAVLAAARQVAPRNDDAGVAAVIAQVLDQRKT